MCYLYTSIYKCITTEHIHIYVFIIHFWVLTGIDITGNYVTLAMLWCFSTALFSQSFSSVTNNYEVIL